MTGGPAPCSHSSGHPLVCTCSPCCRRVDVHDALAMGLADHGAVESSSEEVALRVAREIAQAREGGLISGSGFLPVPTCATLRRAPSGAVPGRRSCPPLPCLYRTIPPPPPPPTHAREARWRCAWPRQPSAWAPSWTWPAGCGWRRHATHRWGGAQHTTAAPNPCRLGLVGRVREAGLAVVHACDALGQPLSRCGRLPAPRLPKNRLQGLASRFLAADNPLTIP